MCLRAWSPEPPRLTQPDFAVGSLADLLLPLQDLPRDLPVVHALPRDVRQLRLEPHTGRLQEHRELGAVVVHVVLDEVVEGGEGLLLGDVEAFLDGAVDAEVLHLRPVRRPVEGLRSDKHLFLTVTVSL